MPRPDRPTAPATLSDGGATPVPGGGDAPGGTRARRTTPGSVNHAIAECAREAALAAQRGLTVAAHRDVYAARIAHPAGLPLPPAYAARFHGLVRDGILVAVAGRTGHTRYAHRDALVGDVDPLEEDDLVRVLQACRAAHERLRRSVTTREVAGELRRLGLVLSTAHPNAVRKRLETLTATRRRGRAEWSQPLVVRETVTSALGRASARWRPAEAPPEPDRAELGVQPASAADALRQVVAHVEAELGRPVSRAELALWLRAHPDHPLRVGLAGARLHVLLPSVATADERAVLKGASQDAGTGRPGAAGRLRRVRPNRARAGLAPVRYTVGEPTSAALCACALEDAVVGLCPADELEEIDVLRRRAARIGVPALVVLAARREVALDAALREATGVAALSDLAAPASRLLAGYERLTGWLAIAAPTSGILTDRRRQMEQRTAGVEACLVLAREARASWGVVPALSEASPGADSGSTGGERPDPTVGDAPVPARPALAPYLDAAGREWDKRPGARADDDLLAGVRRFGEAPGRAAGLQNAPGARLRVDRAEALARLFVGAPVARAGVLVTSAMELLGRIVRDPHALRAVVDQCRPADVPDATAVLHAVVVPQHGTHPSVWRAGVVALGLLGTAPTEADVRAGGGSVREATAVLLAALLASPQAAHAVADRLTEAAAPGVATLALTAMRRLQLGRLLTVVG